MKEMLIALSALVLISAAASAQMNPTARRIVVQPATNNTAAAGTRLDIVCLSLAGNREGNDHAWL